MRYSSVEWTPVVPRRARRRLGPLVWSKWRLPARERRTFPPAVILKRLATDFLVLMPLGRRIHQSLSVEKRAQYRSAWPGKQGQFWVQFCLAPAALAGLEFGLGCLLNLKSSLG